MSTVSNFQNLAVNQDPGLGTGYPFVLPSPDIQYLLGDLWLGYEATATEYQLPLKVAWMYGFAVASNSNPASYVHTHAQDMVITDAAGRVVFDSTQAASFTSTAWGLHLVTLCWIGPAGVLRTTRHTARPAWAAAVTQYEYIAPVNGVLDSRAWERLPRRVTSVTVGEQTFTACDLVLSEGYNLNLTAAPSPAGGSGGRSLSTITLRAKPGDGLGLPPGCESVVTPVLRINGAGPDASGNFTVDAAECYRLQRPVHVVHTSPRQVDYSYLAGTPEAAAAAALAGLPGWTTGTADAAAARAALRLTNDCGPCCECQDFVDTYKGLAGLDQRYRALGAAASATRDQHAANITRWNSQIDCRKATTMLLMTQPEPGGVLFVAGSVINTTGGCITPLVVRLTFETFHFVTAQTGCARILCQECLRAGTDTNYQEVLFTPSGGFPVVDIVYDTADINSISRFRFRIKFCCNAAEKGTVRTTAALAFKTLVSPVTHEAVAFTGAVVPAPVLSLWTADPLPVSAPHVLRVVQQTSPVSRTQNCGSC